VHPKNKTKYKTLNRIASNPKVQEIWDEDVNGLYIALNEGWNLEGNSCFWGSTVKELISSFRRVEKGKHH